MAEVITVVPSSAKVATGNSGSLSLAAQGAQSSFSLLVHATAHSGTPSVVLTVEWSNNGTDFAVSEPADTHGAAITAAPTLRVKRYDVKAPFYRIVWTVTGGTPSLTFSVDQFTYD